MCVHLYNYTHTHIKIILIIYFQVQDICKIHIDDVLTDISEAVLIELPESHASLVQTLIDINEVCTRALTNDYFHIRLIPLSSSWLIDLSLKCQKMVKNDNRCFPKMTFSNVLFCSQLKHVLMFNFTVLISSTHQSRQFSTEKL